MFPWEVHNGWSPSLVQLISVISAIGWAPASLNPLSLLHLPPPPPPHFFFPFLAHRSPGWTTVFAHRFRNTPPPSTLRYGSSTVSRWKWKRMKKNRGTHSLNGTSSSKFFRIVSSEHFLRFRGIFSFLFLFLCKIGRKKRDRRSVLFIVKYHNTVVYTLNILRVFCMSIISIPHNVLHKYSRSGDSER